MDLAQQIAFAASVLSLLVGVVAIAISIWMWKSTSQLETQISTAVADLRQTSRDIIFEAFRVHTAELAKTGDTYRRIVATENDLFATGEVLRHVRASVLKDTKDMEATITKTLLDKLVRLNVPAENVENIAQTTTQAVVKHAKTEFDREATLSLYEHFKARLKSGRTFIVQEFFASTFNPEYVAINQLREEGMCHWVVLERNKEEGIETIRVFPGTPPPHNPPEEKQPDTGRAAGTTQSVA